MFKDFLLPIGITAVGLFAVKKIFGNENSTVDDAGKEVKKRKLTYSKSWYSRNADYLQTELAHLPIGSDNVKNIVLTLAKLKNNDDWLMLISKFGTRSDVPIYWNETLTRLLSQKLSKESFSIYSKINKKTIKVNDALRVVKALFKRKGINF